MRAIGFLAGILLASTSFGQVNVERLPGEGRAPGVETAIDLRLSGSWGNVDRFEIGGGLAVRWHRLFAPAVQPVDAPPFFQRRFVFVIDRDFGSLEGSDFADRGFVHARWTQMLVPRFGFDVFGQYQFDEFRKLRDRAIGGMGLRWDPVREKRAQIWLGSGYMLEFERIDVAPGAPDASEEWHHRWTNYLVVQRTLSRSKATLINTLYFQPRLDLFSDFRLLEVVEVSVPLTEHFALRLDLEIRHDSKPPTGVRATDVRLRNSVAVHF